MKINLLGTKGLKKPALTLCGLLLGAGIGWTQGERMDAEPVNHVPLKSRSVIEESERIYAGVDREYNYLVLHFNENLPSPETLAAKGIKSLNFMDNSTIYADVPQAVDLADLENFAWAMELRPQDKIQKNLPATFARMENVGVTIYLPENLTIDEVSSFVESMNIQRKVSADLPHHIVMANITVTEMNAIAAHNWVSWIAPVPPALWAGEHFHLCLGGNTPYGHQAEFAVVARYVLQGSDWDGPGLGCADLTYHFVNGTPDIAGTGEYDVVEAAMAEWVMYAGLTFTETGTVGLGNSIDISWVSGDHGDGNPFDGPSGVLAHAYYPQYGGEMHFDEAETWTTSGGGIDLFAVAVHELGHALGLAHSDNGSAVMAPYYAGPISGLHPDDIAGIQAIYSAVPCGGGGYCASSGTNSTYEWINSISVNGTSRTSGNNSGYGNFTADPSIGLTPGASAAVNLTPGFSSSTYTEYWRIWVDYNKNNTFDASELVYSGTGTGAVSGSFVVPSGLTGTTRMRISMKYSGYPTPCETFTYGEVEDYTVSFSAPILTYCTASGNSTYEWINNVTIKGVAHNSGNDGGYGNYTGTTFNLNTGSQSVSVSPGFSGSAYTENWKIWVDLNRNGTFEASEAVFTGTGAAAVAGSIVIPSGYEGVTTRMRVSMKYGGVADPCEALAWGEVQDYTVTISPASLVAAIDEESMSYSIYPNPTTSILNIKNSQENLSYQLYDASGRVVSTGMVYNQQLDVSGLAPGHYMIRLSDGNRSQVIAFIRE